MKKEQKYIIAFSIVIFTFAVAKYFVPAGHLPMAFYMFELLSISGILLLIFYTNRMFGRLRKKIKEKNSEIESLTKNVEQLKQELFEKNSFMLNEPVRNVFEDIDNLFVNLPPFAEKNKFCNKVLSILGDNCEIIIGLFFVYNKQSQNFSVEGNYGIQKDEPVTPFNIGEGLHGEALNEREVVVLEEVPEDYFSGFSGLGEAKPKYIYILPLADENTTTGVIELASFKPLHIKEHWEKINNKLLELIIEQK